MLERLDSLLAEGALGDLDVHFARLMARLAGDDSPELVLAACLASHGAGNGHVCVDLREAASQTVLDAASPVVAPPLGPWLERLRGSLAVGVPGEHKPLVLDPVGRLYLYRYWAYEQHLAKDLSARAEARVDDVDEAVLRAGLGRLFPPAGGGADWQKVAAALAVLRRLCVISGGPGTGKTTTVTRILALLAEQSPGQPPRIALAAPTGKAAARVQEAVRLARQRLDVTAPILEAIPAQASTLHRLLGARPDSVHFRHHRDNPLPLDVLVVDEASMVDLALMAKLVDALPPRARLILLGDKDQLASVEAGSVLGDICGTAPGPRDVLRRRLQAVTGDDLPPPSAADSAMADAVVLLRHSYRFGSAGGIGELAGAVNAGEGGAVLRVLDEGRHPDLAWLPITRAVEPGERMRDAVREGFGPYLARIRAGAPPAEVLEGFGQFRILCALRRGPFGVEFLNERVTEAVYEYLPSRGHGPWYPGRPVMVTRNDYHLRLYNGDVGVALPDPVHGGAFRVFFESAEGPPRSFAPGRLPPHETVFAMTVHKSQGSEFERVLLVLPGEPSPVLTRELIYTGITRARQHLTLWGNRAVLSAAVARRTHRASGLGEALWGE